MASSSEALAIFFNRKSSFPLQSINMMAAKIIDVNRVEEAG
jgi:hypothetical protein